VDQPVAHLVARLVDVAPNGQATRVSFGVLNLTHRAGHETPTACVRGEVMTVRLDFKHVAQQFGAGHRLRLAISSHYFPMIWPAPHRVTLSVHTQGSFLELPMRPPCSLDEKVGFGAPEMGPQMEVQELAAGENYWRIVQDAISGVHEMQIAESDGEYRILHNDLTVFSQGYETYSIDPDDIGSATGHTQWEYRLSRGDWQMRSLSETTLTADVDDFIISASVEVWEGETLCHRQSWDRRIPRQLV